MCTYTPFNTTKSSKNISEDELCWENSDLDRFDAYRVALAGFIVLLGKKLNVLKVDLFPSFQSLEIIISALLSSSVCRNFVCLTILPKEILKQIK